MLKPAYGSHALKKLNNEIKLALVAGLLSTQALANTDSTEKITIVGSRDSIAKTFGPSTTIITREEILRKGAPSVTDYLANIPGLFVSRSGSFGGQVSVFVRGAKQEQLMFTIDGVPVNDPSTVGGGFDLSHLSVNDIESIEVYRGAQSILYGSDGLGGIINIVTIKEKSFNRYFVEGGSLGHGRGGFSTGHKGDNLSVRVSAEHWQIDGLSDADESLGNAEADGYYRNSGSGYLSYSDGDWQTSLSVQAVHAEKELDSYNSDFVFVDDPNFVAHSRQQSAIWSLSKQWNDISWQVQLSQSNINREYLDEADLLISPDQSAQYKGINQLGSLTASTILSEDQILDIGLQFEKEKADTKTRYSESDETDDSKSGFIQWESQVVENINIQFGFRRDDYKRSGVEDTGNLRINYSIGSGTLYTIASRAFKAPTLYQTFDPTYGNPDLKAERSSTYEVGYRINMGIAFASASLYQNEFRELIDYNFSTSKYYNASGLTTTRGGELEFGHIWSNHKITLSTSYLDMSKNSSPLLRRPQNTYGAAYDLFIGDYDLGISYKWIGKRTDSSTDLPAREQVHAYGSWKKNNVRIYTRWENLLNKKIVQVPGYTPQGRTGIIGMSYQH